jgi:tRNA-uridine 2-sulfurtransferase
MGIDPHNGQRVLMRGLDHRKDQSYVLFGMTRHALEHTLLPIGEFEKSAVRSIAEELRLPVFNKPDSQEICFVPNQDYAALMQRRQPEAFSSGQLVMSDGKLVGTHEGHQHFTVGQRKGVGVALGYPIYVVDIDSQTNTVTLGDKEALLKQSLVATQINVLSSRLQESGDMTCTAKIRYNHAPQPARVKITGADEMVVEFDEPQSAITPGQAVVVYDGDIVLGGGWIERAGPL